MFPGKYHQHDVFSMMEEIPNNHLLFMKPYQKSDILHGAGFLPATVR